MQHIHTTPISIINKCNTINPTQKSNTCISQPINLHEYYLQHAPKFSGAPHPLALSVCCSRTSTPKSTSQNVTLDAQRYPYLSDVGFDCQDHWQIKIFIVIALKLLQWECTQRLTKINFCNVIVWSIQIICTSLLTRWATESRYVYASRGDGLCMRTRSSLIKTRALQDEYFNGWMENEFYNTHTQTRTDVGWCHFDWLSCRHLVIFLLCNPLQQKILCPRSVSPRIADTFSIWKNIFLNAFQAWRESSPLTSIMRVVIVVTVVVPNVARPDFST
jgi:hypothetical protein